MVQQQLQPHGVQEKALDEALQDEPRAALAGRQREGGVEMGAEVQTGAVRRGGGGKGVVRTVDDADLHGEVSNTVYEQKYRKKRRQTL